MTKNRSPLKHLDMADVRAHYIIRLKTGKRLRTLLEAGSVDAYVNLALGISNAHGNYSASDHNLGPRILGAGSLLSVFQLAHGLSVSPEAQAMLKLIYASNISNLKISVGSEMAMLLRPRQFWVANTRSVWAHLLVKHDFDYSKANEELLLYRDQDSTSEMEYQKWRQIYSQMKQALFTLGKLGDEEADAQQVKFGKIRYVWFDALANALYEHEHG